MAVAVTAAASVEAHEGFARYAASKFSVEISSDDSDITSGESIEGFTKFSIAFINGLKGVSTVRGVHEDGGGAACLGHE
ncbi:hypothetical protein L917_15165 [Phytophthora nicotianae]|uniref:Uncharacterized protein n=1 Tax=Phytophthora nicotianae TaxID=4792 RepID=W2MPV1_PHYNI|nr:hypothetical protein L917_15165 [Phytophthora nicotianae]ETM38407.1 hypothetical protein L914_15304 [Phytophthora nicotianae]